MEPSQSDSTTGVAAPPDHNLAGTLGTSTETPREMGGSADVLATPTVSATNAPGISLELRRLRKRFDRVHTVLLSYMGHLMRKHHQGGALDVLLSELAPGHGICIADYLMKQLLRTYRQAKGEMIGQAGVSVHILYCIFRVPAAYDVSQLKTDESCDGVLTVGDKDYVVVPHRAISDDSKQNWFHTCGELEMSLEALKAEFPTIHTMHLLSDGASNYDCTATMIALREISERIGVKVRGQDNYESSLTRW
eukprot:9481325-Pyramimonas_sp.AAC.1